MRPDWFIVQTSKLWANRWRGRVLTATTLRRLKEMAGAEWRYCRALWLSKRHARNQ